MSRQTILITGASSGIGKATARYFHNKGWNVVASMRKPENEIELTEVENLKIVSLDVLNIDSVNAAVQQAIEAFDGVDVVLNNAGYGTAGPFEAATRAQVRRQFDTNVIGLMDVTRAMLPHFRARKSGLFINISSVGGFTTFPTFSLYHGTKWAVEGFSESLSYELYPLGIRVKIVEPGGVKTDFAGRSLDILEDPSHNEYDNTITKLREAFDEERRANYSTPEFIAEVIYKAATDGTTQLRYQAGLDADQMWETRKQLGDGIRNAVAQRILGWTFE